ncbi:MAG: hypothetical protein JKY65_14915 [Planctomycetes bacterium]|nr:hypothetical protein [Planctomycetota bacterium]
MKTSILLGVALAIPLLWAAPSAAQEWVLDDSLKAFSKKQKDLLIKGVKKAPVNALKDLMDREVDHLASLHEQDLKAFADQAWLRIRAGKEDGHLFRAIRAELKAAGVLSKDLVKKVWLEERERLATADEDLVYSTVDFALRAALVDRIKAVRNARLQAWKATTTGGDARPGEFPLAYANQRASWRETKKTEADVSSSISLPKVRFFSKKAQLEETLLRRTYSTDLGRLTVVGAQVSGLAEAQAGTVSYTDAFGRKVKGLGVHFTAKARLTGVRGDVRSTDFDAKLNKALGLRAHLTAMAQIASAVDGELTAVVTEKGAGIHAKVRGGAGAEARASIPILIDLKVFKVRVIPYVSAHAGASAEAHATLEVEWSGKIRVDLGASFSTGAGVGAGVIIEIELGETLKRALDRLTKQISKLVRPIGDFFMGRQWKGPAARSDKLTLTLGDLERVWARDGAPVRPPLVSDADLAARYAPVIYQEIDKGRMDYLRRVDFDGDWNALNNFANADAGRGDSRGYVYYEIKETETHFFVTYVFFHAGVKSGAKIKFIRKLRSHENDLGGVTMVVAKKARPGREIEAMMAADGDSLRVYDNMPKKVDGKRVRWTRNNGSFQGPMRFVDEVDHPLVDLERTHPQIWIEGRTHEVYAYTGRDDRYAFDGEEGVVYAPTGVAQAPTKHDGSIYGYALRPLSELFEHVKEENFGTQDDRVENGAPLPVYMRGRVGLDDKAVFPWAWRAQVHEEDYSDDDSDSRTEWIEEGQLFTDPVHALKTIFDLPDSFSRRYTRNDFLGERGGAVHKGLLDALGNR